MYKQSSTNKDSYNLVAKNYAEEHSASLVWQEELDTFIKLSSNSKVVIDLGCGHGEETIYLSNKFPNAKIIGVDFSDKMIEIAKARKSKVEFIVHDIVNFKPKSIVNAIWSRASLHHLNDKELYELFENVKKYSSTGLLIGMINKYGSKEEIEEKQKYGTLLKRYFNYFDEDKVNKLAKDFGYKIIDQYKKVDGEHTFLVTFLKNLI